jgi:hypothetical protein
MSKDLILYRHAGSDGVQASIGRRQLGSLRMHDVRGQLAGGGPKPTCVKLTFAEAPDAFDLRLLEEMNRGGGISASRITVGLEVKSTYFPTASDMVISLVAFFLNSFQSSTLSPSGSTSSTFAPFCCMSRFVARSKRMYLHRGNRSWTANRTRRKQLRVGRRNRDYSQSDPSQSPLERLRGLRYVIGRWVATGRR